MKVIKHGKLNHPKPHQIIDLKLTCTDCDCQFQLSGCDTQKIKIIQTMTGGKRLAIKCPDCQSYVKVEPIQSSK